MKKLLIYSLVLCLFSTTTSFASNARTDGAGKLASLTDISNVLGHPASINDFPDQFMGTVGTYTDTNNISRDYYGAFILKKSLGSILNIGLIANTVDYSGSSVLNSNFYHDARSFLLHTPDTSDIDTADESDENMPGVFPMIPHLILGLNLDIFEFGIEFFVEMARFNQLLTGDYTGSIDKKIYNIGTRLSTTIVFNETWLCLFLGLSFPQISGISEIESVKKTFSSIEKRYLSVGTELGTSINNISLVGGLYYTNEHYSFKNNDIESSDYNTNMFYLYLSTKTKILEDMTVGLGYNLTLWNEDILEPDTVTDTLRTCYHGRYAYHNIQMGVEKPFKGKKIFDEIAIRSGIIYSFKKIKEIYNYSGSEEYEVIIDNPLSTKTMKLNAGIGFQKHVFCLDLFVNIGNWSGVITGPKAVSATVTIGLSQDFLDEDRL